METFAIVKGHIKTLSPSGLTRLKTRIRSYLKFRKEIDKFSQRYFSQICTQKCYQDNYSACCNREGITTFFADVVINVLMSSNEEVSRLLKVLTLPGRDPKCVYLGQKGCLWQIKPIVCEMFLCEHLKNSVFGQNPALRTQWEGFKKRKKRYTWPSHPVLFDDLESYFIQAGHTSTLMYFHNSPGLLRVKHLAIKKADKPF